MRGAPLHPQAVAVLQAVRSGAPLDGIPDLAAALRSLTYGSGALLRSADGTLRLTTRGREWLALAGMPRPRPRLKRWVEVRPLSVSTRALLAALAYGPRAWSALASEGVRRGALATAARHGLIEAAGPYRTPTEQAAGPYWTLTERGRAAHSSGVRTTVRVRSIPWGGEVRR